jgi:hypothetical protein
MREARSRTLSARARKLATNFVPSRRVVGVSAAFNGDPSRTLAMLARYVVATGGTIEYADNNVDYTPRGDPSEMIPALARLAAR